MYLIFIPMMILKIIILQLFNPALEQVRQQWLLNILQNTLKIIKHNTLNYYQLLTK